MRKTFVLMSDDAPALMLIEQFGFASSMWLASILCAVLLSGSAAPLESLPASAPSCVESGALGTDPLLYPPSLSPGNKCPSPASACCEASGFVEGEAGSGFAAAGRRLPAEALEICTALSVMTLGAGRRRVPSGLLDGLVTLESLGCNSSLEDGATGVGTDLP